MAPTHHEFAIYPVQDGLQVVTLAGVLAVKQLQQPYYKVLVNVLLGCLGVCVIVDHIPQQELIDDLHR